jgi:tetratricopeptide (TPR) repeat protein
MVESPGTVRARGLGVGVLLALLAAGAARPADPPPALAQGLELFRKGQRTGAEPLLREGLGALPDHVEGLLALARIYLGWDDHESALPRAEEAARLAPDSSETQLILAQARGLKAREISRLRAMLMVGDIRSGFERAVALDPRHLEARLSLMEFYLQAPSLAGGDLDKAREQAEAAVALEPRAGLPALARVAAAQGRMDQALAALDRLAPIDRGGARVARALLYAEDKRTRDRAVAELLAVAAEDPQDAADLTTAGVLLGQLGQPVQALALVEQARRADPAYAPAAYQLGRLLLLSGRDLPRAEAAFLAYLAGEPPPGSPRPAWAHLRLGQVYRAQGRAAEARREFGEALRLDPKNAEARKALRER